MKKSSVAQLRSGFGPPMERLLRQCWWNALKGLGEPKVPASSAPGDLLRFGADFPRSDSSGHRPVA